MQNLVLPCTRALYKAKGTLHTILSLSLSSIYRRLLLYTYNMELLPLTIKTILGQDIYVVTEPSSLVQDLKLQIEKCDGIPSNMQVLLFNGKELCNNQAISYYRLHDNCILQMAGKYLGGATDMTIFLKTMSGKTTQIQVSPDDTVEMVKRKVERLHGVQVEHQQLIYGGKQLHNSFKLKDYKILPDSALFLVLRLRGGGDLDNGGGVLTDEPISWGTDKLYKLQVYQNNSHMKAAASFFTA
jgi:hypothetical protein